MSSIRKAAFEVVDASGQRQAEITVIDAFGSYLANVVRWRGQIGLGDMTPEELDKALVDVPVGKYTNTCYVIHAIPVFPAGPSGSGSPEYQRIHQIL